MKSGVLWNEVITAMGRREYPDVALRHQLADALGMSLVREPKRFDVIVTDNLFGDMLSDVAAMLTGSIGMLPSASLGDVDAATGRRKALYEPVHGSAPDIAGQGLANPIAMIGSLAMAMRYTFERGDLADRIEAAIAAVLAKGLRTADIKGGRRALRLDHADGRRDRRRAEGVAAGASGATRLAAGVAKPAASVYQAASFEIRRARATRHRPELSSAWGSAFP